MQFTSNGIFEELTDRAARGGLDDLEFGVIGFDEDEAVTHYNEHESLLAGLDLDAVLGRDVFVEVAPCMNNFMVSERFVDEEELDEVVDYVLTLKMKPTKVQLRLLQRPDAPVRFILIQR